MKIIRSRVIRFNVVHDNGHHDTIDFIPYDNVPGWTHRIAYNGRLTAHWVCDKFKPSVEVAQFFLDKILATKP
jgi:hypothetical protein